MSVKTKIAAAAAIAVFVAPTHHSAAALLHAKSPPQWTGNAIYGAYAAAKKSPRAATPSLSRTRISQAAEPRIRVVAPDGRDLGTDPDPSIRFQLLRDSSVGMGMGGGGM